jgi:L-amino acid N-acyltransferase YncA
MASPRALPPFPPRAVALDGGATATLRLMTAADTDRLVAFARRLPADDLLFLSLDLTSRDAVGEWARGLEEGRTVVVLAEADSDLAGYAALAHDQVTWQRHLGEIWIQVSARHRGRGLGRHLANEISGLSRALGLRKFVARMTPDQKGAIATFERLGFAREAILQDFVVDSAGRTRDLLVLARDVPAST